MSNGHSNQQALEVIKRRIDELKDAMLKEYQAVLDKLPWWQAALIWAGGIASLIGGIAACGAISGATGPAAAIAWALCVAAIISLLASIIGGLICYVDESGENEEIEKKNLKLEELKTLLQQMQQAIGSGGG